MALQKNAENRQDQSKSVEQFLRGAGHNIRWKPHANQLNQVVDE